MARRIIVFIVLYVIYMIVLLVVGLPFLISFLTSSTTLGPDGIPVLSTSAFLTGIGGAIVLVGAPIVMFLIFYKRAPAWREQVVANGRPAKAVVTQVADTGVSESGGMTLYVRLTLKVQPESGAPVEATIETPVSRVEIPRAGDKLMVRYDPDNHAHMAIINS